MMMQRQYFICNSLDELENFEEQLEAGGISVPQLHVLSADDGEVANHQHLHEVQSIMKVDLVHASLQGAAVGVALSVTVVLVAHLFELTNSAAGWTPFAFLMVILLGFCTWEGGFIGIQRKNYKFARFEEVLAAGQHVFFVDLEPGQKATLDDVLKIHPNILPAGSEPYSQHWLIILQRKFGVIRHS